MRSPSLHLHPNDADHLGVADGDTVKLTTSAGAVHVTVLHTDDIVEGTVSYPHGWTPSVTPTATNINAIIPNNIETKEPCSGMSLLDGVPVTIARVPAAAPTAAPNHEAARQLGAP